MIFRFMNDQKQFHSVELMARVLKVSRSGYYAWRRRAKSARAQQSERLVAEIRFIQEQVSRYRYGSPRVHDELRNRGWCVSRKRVAQLMRTHGLGARRRKKFRVTTKSSHQHVAAPNLLNREFNVRQLNRVWVSDYTYVATAEGWLYLCVILDLANREVVGWSMSSYLGTDTLLKAFWSAVHKCQPGEGLIFHSDRGVQYASGRFRRVLKSCRLVQSMSRKGDCWDNAPAESFFKTLKSELIGEYVYPTRTEAQQAIFEYIEVFYNRVRRHSYLGYLTPLEYRLNAA